MGRAGSTTRPQPGVGSLKSRTAAASVEAALPRIGALNPPWRPDTSIGPYRRLGIRIRARGGYVYILAMSRIFPWLLGVILWVGAAEKPPVLLRVHLQAPEGAKGMVTVPITLLNPPENIAIRNIPEVSEKDIRSVRSLADGTVVVEFDDFGKTKLEVATNTGRGLIMVVIVNGRVVYAPTVDTNLTQGALALPAGAIFPEEIQALNDARNKERAQKLKEL